MSDFLYNVVFISIWIGSIGSMIYGGYHSLMAMNIYPITGFRNFVWPPIQDLVPVELPVQYILHRNKARRAITLFFGIGIVGFVVMLATAFLRTS